MGGFGSRSWKVLSLHKKSFQRTVKKLRFCRPLNSNVSPLLQFDDMNPVTLAALRAFFRQIGGISCSGPGLTLHTSVLPLAAAEFKR
jgi:hypothetical protein